MFSPLMHRITFNVRNDVFHISMLTCVLQWITHFMLCSSYVHIFVILLTSLQLQGVGHISLFQNRYSNGSYPLKHAKGK
jgi:hypothetical protein